jgi:hypothetical protein
LSYEIQSQVTVKCGRGVVAGWVVPLILGYQKSGVIPSGYYAGIVDAVRLLVAGVRFDPAIVGHHCRSLLPGG